MGSDYPRLCQMSFTQKSGHTQVDRWTLTETGCSCPQAPKDNSCPCCSQGGCSCGRGQRCVQCGLEQGCVQSKIIIMYMFDFYMIHYTSV